LIKQHTPITIIIADDHPVFRKGLREMIAEDKRFQVAAETGDGTIVLELVQRLKPEVLLLDLNMPGSSGLDVAAAIQESEMPVHVIALTMHKEEAIFNKAMDLGVRGYILKESAVSDILGGIDAVAGGGYYISPAISQYLMNRRAHAASLLQEHPGLQDLSAAERRILKLISRTKSSKEISEILFISVRTVENHRMNISVKLNLRGSNSLLKFAIENKSYL